jgi:hypothetical protein
MRLRRRHPEGPKTLQRAVAFVQSVRDMSPYMALARQSESGTPHEMTTPNPAKGTIESLSFRRLEPVPDERAPAHLRGSSEASLGASDDGWRRRRGEQSQTLKPRRIIEHVAHPGRARRVCSCRKPEQPLNANFPGRRDTQLGILPRPDRPLQGLPDRRNT